MIREITGRDRGSRKRFMTGKNNQREEKRRKKITEKRNREGQSKRMW